MRTEGLSVVSLSVRPARRKSAPVVQVRPLKPSKVTYVSWETRREAVPDSRIRCAPCARAGKTCIGFVAVRGFSEALRAELLGSPVGLTVVYPGAVDTNLVRTGRAVSAAQREAEARFVTRRALPASRVTRRILQGIQRKSARVVVGLDYHLIDWMTRLSPELSQVVTARMSQRMPF